MSCISDDKFRQLFQCVDRNRDGFISKDEFYFVVFPKEAEEDKLKVNVTLQNDPIRILLYVIYVIRY